MVLYGGGYSPFDGLQFWKWPKASSGAQLIHKVGDVCVGLSIQHEVTVK